MTHHDIIERLYRSRELDDCISKLIRPDHRSDFKHELILVLYGLPHHFICSLFNSSGLTFYVVRSIINLSRNKHDVYLKNYTNQNIDLLPDMPNEIPSHEDCDMEKREAEEQREIDLLFEINHRLDDPDRFPYYRSIIEQVAKHGGIRAASRELGIPKTTIFNSIKKVRDKLNGK